MPIKVLIAEDSAFVRKKISQILSSNNLIEVVAAAKNGEEAVELTLKYLPDVLILDLLMPKMNGLEAFKRIMNEYTVPTIILSSMGPSNLDSSIQALIIGAFDYIMKPGTLKGESLTHFKDILIDKVKLASKSHFKRADDKNEKKFTQISPRQKLVNEIFEFGRFLKKIESSDKSNSKTKLKNIEDLNSVQKNVPLSEFKRHKKNKKEKKRVPKNIEKDSKDVKKPKNKTSIKNKNGKKKELLKKTKTFKESENNAKENKNGKRKYDNYSKSVKQTSKETPILSGNLKKSNLYPDQISKDINLENKDKKTSLTAIDLLSNRNFQKSNIKIHRKLIVIGASVGGPQTIKTILKKLPKDYPFPIIIVQHLNSKFIKPFAQSMDELCPIKVKVAEHNELIKSSVVYIAPGEKHIKVSTKNHYPSIKIFNDISINFCKPSIDILFISASQVYKNRVVGILLTGMGKDGVKGIKYIYNNNGFTISESEETAILYGMPKFAVEKGVVNKSLPIDKISELLIRYSNT
ncbi:MAG: response regulator [Promethearchaeota archaeon]|nr:MAG: response regulator [Candidatus Lokiarchaeota archaeon]